MGRRESEQVDDPVAATPLHDRFAAGLRVLLRHKLPTADLETGVFYVLVTVARAIRERKIRDDQELLAQVRKVADGFIKQATITQPSSPPDAADQWRRTLERMDPADREIIIRFYRLAQSEEEICREMNIPRETVQKVKRNARERFLLKKAVSNSQK